jgi:chromosome segregation ATPase
MYQQGDVTDYNEDIDESINIEDAIATFIPPEILQKTRALLTSANMELEETQNRLKRYEERYDAIYHILMRLDDKYRGLFETYSQINAKIDQISNFTERQFDSLTQIFTELKDNTSCDNKEQLVALVEEVLSKLKSKNPSARSKIMEFMQYATTPISFMGSAVTLAESNMVGAATGQFGQDIGQLFESILKVLESGSILVA